MLFACIPLCAKILLHGPAIQNASIVTTGIVFNFGLKLQTVTIDFARAVANVSSCKIGTKQEVREIDDEIAQNYVYYKLHRKYDTMFHAMNYKNSCMHRDIVGLATNS